MGEGRYEIDEDSVAEPISEQCYCLNNGNNEWIWHYSKYNFCMGAVVVCSECGGQILQAIVGLGKFDGIGQVKYLKETRECERQLFAKKFGAAEVVDKLSVPKLDIEYPFADLFMFQYEQIINDVTKYDGMW